MLSKSSLGLRSWLFLIICIGCFWDTPTLYAQRQLIYADLYQPSCSHPPKAGNPFHAGNGSVVLPYLICNANDLLNINNVDAYLSKYFVLGTDIDMQGIAFNGIGAYPQRPFTGNFDGKNHIINNLQIGNGTLPDIGLFNYVSDGAIIRNLQLTGVQANGTMNVGALIGRAQTSGTQKPVRIDNCNSSGNITSSLVSGGLVGLFSHNSNNPALSRLLNSYSTATVRANINSAGGLIGKLSGAKASLEDSFAAGHVSSPSRVGGVVGVADSNFSITDVYFTGILPLTPSSTQFVGGIIGLAANGSLLRSYVTSTVNGSDNVGGLIGNATGTLVQESFSSGAVNGFSNTGGLIGLSNNNVIVKDSYTRGNISCISNCGGIVGDIEITAAGTTYQRVYATGMVSPTDDLMVCFAQNVESGALIGEINPVATMNSIYWNTQTSQQCTAAGNLTPFSDVGTGLTTAQMANAVNFSGWDFTNVWIMPAGGPPKLRWE